MAISPLAGKPAPQELLIDPAALERAYYAATPASASPVEFGTSGHRGSPLDGTFTEPHILAIAQAIADYRREAGIDGPVFLGADSHAASAAAARTALEVLAANGVTVLVSAGGELTPTPAVSRAILAYNRGRESGLADGVIITPSHNPPADGGIKYNPPEGGPADASITKQMQARANELLRAGNAAVRRVPYDTARRADSTREFDFLTPYVTDLANVIDMDAIRAAGVRIGVDPLGGASVGYWQPIAERYGLNLTVVNQQTDPTFGFMTVDHDGKIRMDCSSPYAMAGLIGLKDQFDVAWGCDPDADRHGIVARSAGLLNPNHYLAVAIEYLIKSRAGWPHAAKIGKTLVSSSLIDRVVREQGRVLYEVPVGFKWFAGGLYHSDICFGGEESAGASFLRRDGKVWTTDKDGLILGLLSAEILARTGKDPGEHYRALTERFGVFHYTRIDTPATPAQKAALAKLSRDAVKASYLAGDEVTGCHTNASGNREAIGGLKVETAHGWFAARPSGTENIYKLYAESDRGPEHLDRIVTEARAIVLAALG
jgi:phosphoglucomutase